MNDMRILVSTVELSRAAAEMNEAMETCNKAIDAFKIAAADLANKWEGGLMQELMINLEEACRWYAGIHSLVAYIIDTVNQVINQSVLAEESISAVVDGGRHLLMSLEEGSTPSFFDDPSTDKHEKAVDDSETSQSSKAEQDPTEAIEWYRRAAEQGNTSAQIALGDCYRNGTGIRQDPTEAMEWYRRAAEQGNAAALSQKAGAGSDVELEKVEFSAIAPKSVAKGEHTIINIFMYEESCRHIVDELIRESDEPVQETKSGVHKVKENSSIKIVLTSPDVAIEDNVETGVWQGEYLEFSFAVFLPDRYERRQILFNAAVYINDVIATRLKFIVKCSSFFEQKITVSRKDILSAFVSYASQDRHRVASIVQGMKKARQDMDIFFDVDSLRSGENWEKVLYQEIGRRDVLFLCWSHFARESKWVDMEWRYALAQKGEECIEPVSIEPPDVCPPPEELKHKHFNDRLLYFIIT